MRDEELTRWLSRPRWWPLAVAAVILLPILFGVISFAINASVTGHWPKQSSFGMQDKD